MVKVILIIKILLMQNLLQTSSDMIKKFEGLRKEAYRCSAGVWTIGYGTTFINKKPVQEGDVIGIGAAERLLIEEIKSLNTFLEESLPKTYHTLTDNQKAVLISFTYNVGRNAAYGSTFFRRIREGKLVEASNELLRWNKETVNGKKVVNKGLANRRRQEAKLWLSDINQEGDNDKTVR